MNPGAWKLDRSDRDIAIKINRNAKRTDPVTTKFNPLTTGGAKSISKFGGVVEFFPCLFLFLAAFSSCHPRYGLLLHYAQLIQRAGSVFFLSQRQLGDLGCG